MSTPIETLLERAAAMGSDAEVVTEAHLRKVSLPGGAGVMGLITLDNGQDHTRPNTFGPRGLVALNAAIDAALGDDEITSLGVTGKPFILAAGADLTAFAAGGVEGVRTIAELGHAVFRKLGEGGKPSFGFVNGLALGGGLEITLHCDYRTVMDSAAAVGLPEVMLGLIPGWGGAYLVPQLVGADRAVTLILENPLNQGRTLKGRQAFELGLADACFSGADYLEQSLLWAARVLTGAETVQRPEVDRGDAWDAAVARGRGIADSKTGGASPAAYRAVELIEGALAKTANNTGCTLVIALNYGSQDELVRAANRAAQKGEITLEALETELDTADLPPLDLLIRTSGEIRLSNFLLWQAAYAELYFTDMLWPDFDGKALATALESFAGRERRYGGL